MATTTKTTTPTTTTTTIVKHHKTKIYTPYDVSCFNHKIRTVVTHSPTMVTSWINHVRNEEQHPITLVGLDTEWLNPIATLQLCVGSHCLIYQLGHTWYIPSSLKDLLRDPHCTFTGLGVLGDAKSLSKDYGLTVSSIRDVGKVAAEEGKVRVNAGLKEVTKAVLGWEMEKKKEITMSKWYKRVLNDEQVKYACIDAFVSYHLGKELISPNNSN